VADGTRLRRNDALSVRRYLTAALLAHAILLRPAWGAAKLDAIAQRGLYSCLYNILHRDTNNRTSSSVSAVGSAMLRFQGCLSLVRKYGPAAKVVVTSVLNVVAPGSGQLIDLAGQAIDTAKEVADKTAQEDSERELLTRLKRSEAELGRLGELFEKLAGPLAAVCDKASAFADQPDDLPDIIGRAIAADPRLSQVLHEVGGLKEQFDVFQADLKRLADHQEEAVPVYARMNRVADYFDELWQAGITPRVFAQCLHNQRAAALRIEQDNIGEVDNLVLELRTAAPKAASVCVLEAAAATREFNYVAAQRSLGTAMRLRPGDAELAELSRRVTVLATKATPKSPTPSSGKPDQPRRLQPGDTLDGWLLETRLGTGGWGQVFKAVCDGNVRALKVMHPDFAADRAFVERFKKEIETLIKLPRHTNLVRIDGWGFCPARQTWYLTMEYVDGPTLEQYLANVKRPLSEAEVRAVFAHTVEGLAKAHAAGIVHRDLKPGNLIFRRSDRRLVIVDFGLAVGVEDFGQTKVGGISIQFAAPEQHYGERATQASDVFSLCAVIHYALHYDNQDLRKPHRFSPSLAPEQLRDALARGMKTNVEERFQNAGQLLQALVPVAKAVEDSKPVPPTADPVTDYAQWKKQVDELKAQAGRAADVFNFAQAVAILEKVPAKHRDNELLADWTRKRDRLAELWGRVEAGWRDMTEDELVDDLEEMVGLHPDHPQAKPWLARVCGSEQQRRQRRLGRGKIGDVIEVPLTSALKMKFAWVPPGTSWLGGGDGKPGQQQFTLPKGLWCGVYPVTQAEWQAVMGDNPSHFKNNLRHPVENVSYNRVEEFLKTLTTKLRDSGLLYRLPSSEEWEYICRGGPISQDLSKYHFYFARSRTDLTPVRTNDLSSNQANFNGEHPAGAAPKAPNRQATSEVDLFLPNPLGIYDLHGNVWEWTTTPEGSGRVVRGGGWNIFGVYCSASYRFRLEPDYADDYLGFRLLAVPVG
jgi:formylglycine-generating enzyme required for sulfatase activity